MGYQELYESLKTRNDQLEAKVTFLEQENHHLKLEKKQWELDKMHQASIIQQTLNGVNSESQELKEENARLREEIKKLRE